MLAKPPDDRKRATPTTALPESGSTTITALLISKRSSDDAMSNLKSLKISKTDAARRQLEAAIRLWFFDGDPVSVHTLAAAAHQIVHDLGKARGVFAALRELPEIQPEFKKEIHAAISKAENFFKHADRDPDALLDFNPVTSTYYLLDASMTYEALTGERPHILRAFQMWMSIHNPSLLKDEFKADWEDRMRRAGAGLKHMAKQEFFTLYPIAIAKSEAKG